MSGAPSLDDELPSIGRASDGPIAGNGAADPFKQASNGHATPIELPSSPRTADRSPSRSRSPPTARVKDNSACVMSGQRRAGQGRRRRGARRVDRNLTPSQALALGGLRADLPDTVMSSPRSAQRRTRPDVIARTNDNIVYHGPAFVLLDYDTKGMPASVTAELKRLRRLLAGAADGAAGLGQRGPADAELDQRRPVAQPTPGLRSRARTAFTSIVRSRTAPTPSGS